jgi:uncharacterized protein (TIGR03382 family)
MKRTLGHAVLAVVLAVPVVAMAGPSRWGDEERPVITERMGDNDAFTCSAGSEGALPIGAAVLGLMLWRRRSRE